MSYDLDSLKAIPIRQVADRLALEFKGKNAKCFNEQAHSRGDKNPSLGLDLKTNRFKCFACDVKGSTIDLVMQAQGLDFKQACEWLANAFGIAEVRTISNTSKSKMSVNVGNNKETTKSNPTTTGDIELYKKFYELCSPIDQAGQDFLINKGFTSETRDFIKWRTITQKAIDEIKKTDQKELEACGLKGLFGCKDWALIPFYKDEQIVYLRARNIKEKSFRNLIDKETEIYNFNALYEIKDKIYIAEGETDTISLYQSGLPAVGLTGATQDDKLRHLAEIIANGFGSEIEAILCFDNDRAGNEATKKAVKEFADKGIIAKIKKLPDEINDISDTLINGYDIASLPEVEPEGQPKPLSSLIDSIFDQFGDGSRQFTGLQTGFDKLDDATLGLDGLIVLSGKSGGGKTSLAIQLAYQILELENAPVIIYSLEMGKRQVLARLLAQTAKIEERNIHRAGKTNSVNDYLSKSDYEKLANKREYLKKIGGKLYIIDRADGLLSFDAIKEQLKLIKALHKTDKAFVVVDHLQVFNVNREQSYYADQIGKETAIINGFKDIQELTGATILLLSQENKSKVNSGEMTAVKGTSDIVYLADMVMQIVSKDEDTSGEIANYSTKQEVVLKITKNRYGERKGISYEFEGKTTSFREI